MARWTNRWTDEWMDKQMTDNRKVPSVYVS